jgi:A/G-specific adenine glycosylase
MNRQQRFIETVWKYYQSSGRHDLPWRKVRDPYKILVSEIMLQQTQVERVVPKYKAFLKEFPTVRRLAAAPVGDVLRAWQGLGYNRRAKFLWLTAQYVAYDLKGKWPMDELGLRSLPGVGLYTAGAVRAFAHNESVVLIETNIRQVFIYHFFKSKTDVSDVEIVKMVKKTLPKGGSCEWYWALMDYGAYLKQVHGNLNRKSKHYTKQSKFQDSDRQIRGAILRTLATTEPQTIKMLQVCLDEYEAGRVATQLARLTEEHLIVKVKGKYQLS